MTKTTKRICLVSHFLLGLFQLRALRLYMKLFLTMEKINEKMRQKLKILTVDRKNDDGYWIAGVFNTSEDIAKYIELNLFDDAVVEVQEFEYPREDRALENGEYAYQIVVVNPEKFVIEQIIAPENFKGFYVEENPKSPLRIYLSAKNAAEVEKKCLKIMADRLVV